MRGATGRLILYFTVLVWGWHSLVYQHGANLPCFLPSTSEIPRIIPSGSESETLITTRLGDGGELFLIRLPKAVTSGGVKFGATNQELRNQWCVVQT